MRNIAIIYTTRKGQTAKIARFMQSTLEDQGCNVEMYNLKEVTPSLGSQIDGVILGGPVYAGHYHRSLRKWVRRNQAELKEKRMALFVVALNTADKHEKARHDDDQLLRNFISWTGVVPSHLTNVAGALKYTQYNPLIRAQMKKIAAAAGGDLDTSRDFEYTDWNAVKKFCEDFRQLNADSPFALDRRLPMDRAFNAQLRFFEQSSESKIAVAAPASIAYAAFSFADSREMRGATALATIRTLGTASPLTRPSFVEASQEFGVIPLGDDAPREILGGLVGQFWKFNFGIQRMTPPEFLTFEKPGFTKVVTRFEFVDTAEGRSEIRAQMRAHSTDENAARRFRIYWWLLSFGISLYMRSLLRGLKRQAERQRPRLPLTATKA